MQSFIKNHQHKKEYGTYHNSRRNVCRFDMNTALKFKKAHKKIGASSGLWGKQFDTRRRDYCKHFNAHSNVPLLFELPNTVWGFGHHNGLGQTKFCY